MGDWEPNSSTDRVPKVNLFLLVLQSSQIKRGDDLMLPGPAHQRPVQLSCPILGQLMLHVETSL